MMKSEKMIERYIDYLVSIIPSNLSQEELEDKLLVVAEQIKQVKRKQVIK